MARIRKFVVALVGALANAAALGLLPDPWGEVVAGVVTILAAVGVYTIPNAPPPLDVPSTRPLTPPFTDNF